MKIGFDAKRAFLNGTGLGNYSRTTILSMCASFPEHRYCAFTPKVRPNVYYDQLIRQQNLELVTAPAVMPGSLWRSWGVVHAIKEQRLDVYHGLSNELPLNAKSISCKKVVTIHDLIFESHPKLYKPVDRKIYHYKFKSACLHADTVIAISEYTRQEIVKRYGIDAQKIVVLYQDAAGIFKKSYSEEQLVSIREKYRLPDRFILQVGTVEKRKNAKITIQALQHLEEEIPLVIVGRATAYQQELLQYIREQQLGHRVIFRNEVTYFDLPLIYRLATAFVYPSRVEGFGIPVLEGLYSGIPVVAATGSCLEEAGGTESLYFHPDDAKGLARHLDHMISGAFRPDASKIRAHLSRFDPLQLSQQLMNIYQAT